jgi:predicted nucleic-acid-binding protein
MRMKGVDTNILVRFLVGDDEIQSKKVYKFFKKAEAKNDTLFIPLLVVLELIWVLESAYQISRKEIVESISDMLLMPILRFEHQSALQQFTHFSQNNNYDLSDLIIAYSAKEQGCESVLTFDKRASKSDLFELMS